MANNIQMVGTYGGSIVPSLVALQARIRAKAHTGLKALQMARMLSTLSKMSDLQLSQIGISRSDIPKYAESLLADT